MSDTEQREADQLEDVPFPEAQPAVIGHEDVLAGLIQTVDAERIPGGLLLHGPRGIGKGTLAFHLAKLLFARTSDERPDHIEAQVAAGAYPNLRVLRRRPRDTGKGFYTAIRVEDVRDLIADARLTRGRAGFRAVIVDAIDDCNAASANALLKILEEPPPQTLFILISHRPGGLLPTIRSRCRQVAMRPLADADVRRVLGEGEGRDMAVTLAGGRPRRGFEALALGDNAALSDLSGWLKNPGAGASGVFLGVADKLAADKEGAAFAFAQEMLGNWIAAEARRAAIARSRPRLASAQALWDKATALNADAEIYNLDARQTLVAIMDAIRGHAQIHLLTDAAR